MQRTVQRELDRAALFWLVIVMAGSAFALWLAWNHYHASTALHRITRAKGFVSDFGNAATGICAVAIPLAIWLFRKALFGKYKLGPRR